MLYGSISKMLAQGLIEESDDRPDPHLDDERRRYYRITAFGRKVAHAEVARMLKIAENRDRLTQLGADPVGSTPDEFAAYIRTETEKWARVVKASGAKAD